MKLAQSDAVSKRPPHALLSVPRDVFLNFDKVYKLNKAQKIKAQSTAVKHICLNCPLVDFALLINTRNYEILLIFISLRI